MNDDIEMIWKKVVAAKERHYPSTYLEGSKKATEELRMAHVLDKIRNKYLPL
jgi:hypothetical protein